MFSASRAKTASTASGCLLCCSHTLSRWTNCQLRLIVQRVWHEKKSMFSQDTAKSIDLILTVSLEVLVQTCARSHTVWTFFLYLQKAEGGLPQPKSTGRPSLKIDMMAIKGGLVEWNAMNNLPVRQGSKERGGAWRISGCVLFFFPWTCFWFIMHSILFEIFHARWRVPVVWLSRPQKQVTFNEWRGWWSAANEGAFPKAHWARLLKSIFNTLWESMPVCSTAIVKEGISISSWGQRMMTMQTVSPLKIHNQM